MFPEADKAALQALQKGKSYTIIEETSSGVQETTFTPAEIREAARRAEETPDD